MVVCSGSICIVIAYLLTTFMPFGVFTISILIILLFE